MNNHPFEQNGDLEAGQRNEGYLIVLKPDILLRQYNQLMKAFNVDEYLRELREAFAPLNPTQYRGVSRDPMMVDIAYNQKQIYRMNASSGEIKDDACAHRYFREIFECSGGDENIEYGILPSLSDAAKIRSLADDPETWEIIQIARFDESLDGNPLGFDIGYWASDHFSLIADTIVIPRWHPAPPEDFRELKNAMSSLNENLLFDTAEAARSFKEYYKSFPWAEEEMEDGQFCIIRVARPIV